MSSDDDSDNQNQSAIIEEQSGDNKDSSENWQSKRDRQRVLPPTDVTADESIVGELD